MHSPDLSLNNVPKTLLPGFKVLKTSGSEKRLKMLFMSQMCLILTVNLEQFSH